MPSIKHLNKHQEIITSYMYLGLLPFFAGALTPWIFSDYEVLAIEWFLLYSAIIFAFLSGIIWATVLLKDEPNNTRHLHVAIGFSLLPLSAALFSPLFRTGLMLLGFLLLLFWEKLFLNHLYASWYQQMRHKITFIVVACHMLTILNIIQA